MGIEKVTADIKNKYHGFMSKVSGSQDSEAIPETQSAADKAKSEANIETVIPGNVPISVPKVEIQKKVLPTTIISQEAVITGSIKSVGHISIMGQVIGDVEAGGHISVSGSVKGNIKSISITVDSGVIEADIIEAQKDVTINSGSKVTSDVKCDNFFLASTFVGSVYAQSDCDFSDVSVITGNVKARSISVKPGALIEGKIDIMK